MTESETAQTIAEVLAAEFAHADEVDNLDPSEVAAAVARRLYNRAKASTLEHAMTAGPVMVMVDPRKAGTQLPPDLMAVPLTLRIGYNLTPPIDLDTSNPDAFVATLSFNRRPYHCVVPWEAVWCMQHEGGHLVGLWVDSMPPEVTVAQVEAKPTRAPQPPTPAKPRAKLGLVPYPADEDGEPTEPVFVDDDASGRAFLKTPAADTTKPEIHVNQALDTLASQYRMTRLTSNERTDECPIKDVLNGGWCESDEQLRKRIEAFFKATP